MARRIRETKKNNMAHGLGKTGSKAVDTPSATHREIFQNEDKVPGQKSDGSIKEAHVSALYHCGIALINYSPELRAKLGPNTDRCNT